MKMEQTERSEMSAYKIQGWEITQKKAYNNQDGICTLKSTMAASFYIHTSLLFTVIQ